MFLTYLCSSPTCVYAGKESQAVEAVMKMWPPPAPSPSSPLPNASAPPAHWGAGADRCSSSMNPQENTTALQIPREPGAASIQEIQGPRLSGSILHAG